MKYLWRQLLNFWILISDSSASTLAADYDLMVRDLFDCGALNWFYFYIMVNATVGENSSRNKCRLTANLFWNCNSINDFRTRWKIVSQQSNLKHDLNNFPCYSQRALVDEKCRAKWSFHLHREFQFKICHQQDSILTFVLGYAVSKLKMSFRFAGKL